MKAPSRFARLGWIVSVCAVAAAVGLSGCTAPIGPGPPDGLTEDPPVSPAPETPEEPGADDGHRPRAEQRIGIDFDSGSPGYVGESFAGAGIVHDAPAGYLDAHAWQILGFSDGDQRYGEEAVTGDFARGMSTGGVGTGGLYAFVVEEDNVALGVQPTASDFAPGSIALRVPITLDSVDEIELAWTLWVYNDQNRSSAWTVAISADGETWVDLPEVSYYTGEAADETPQWLRNDFTVTIEVDGSGLAPDEWLHIRWSSADHSGTGGRDEAAIDDISVKLFGPTDA